MKKIPSILFIAACFIASGQSQELVVRNSNGTYTTESDINDFISVGADPFDFDTQGDYTLVASDASNDKYVFADGTISIPSGVFAEGQSVRIAYAYEAIGDVTIAEGAGVDILGHDGGITLTGYQSGLTLARTSSATSPEIWQVVDSWGGNSYGEVGCIKNPNELDVTANATTDKSCNETADLTGWGGVGNISRTLITETVGDSEYSIRGQIIEGQTSGYFEYTFQGIAGQEYRIELEAKQGQGTEAKLSAWGNLTGGPSNVSLSNSFTTYEYDVTVVADGTCRVRCYPAISGGTALDWVDITYVSIIRTNP